jgi:hypothetical protein
MTVRTIAASPKTRARPDYHESKGSDSVFAWQSQIDATYGHLLPDSEDYLRGLLDAYDERGELETEAFSC